MSNNSKLVTGSICLTDLIEQAKQGNKAFSKAKNGKIYVGLSIWLNDEKDQYDNNGSISLIKSKEDQSKSVYVGNVKYSEKQVQQPSTSDINEMAGAMDDLPF